LKNPGVGEYADGVTTTATPTTPTMARAETEHTATSLLHLIDQADDPQALVDAAWRILYRVRDLATDSHRFKLEFLREGCETGDLNLVEIGINRFYDIDPGEDDDED
jgi:hypothetical protein